MEAPSRMSNASRDDSELSLGCKNLQMCNLQISNILKAIFRFDTAIMQAVCPFLPGRELRSFSLLTSSFRSASTLGWSEDVLETERVLLNLARKDQPQFLAKAIADSGICKASLGRVLLQATAGGRQNRSHRCCRLLGECGAMIRLEDAIMVTGGDPGYHDGVYIRAAQEQASYYCDDCYVTRESASLLDNFQEELRVSGLQSGPHANWQEPLWILVEDGGFVVAYLAFSASAVPPAAGWHRIPFLPLDGIEWFPDNGPELRTRQVQLGDLLDSGPTMTGPLMMDRIDFADKAWKEQIAKLEAEERAEQERRKVL
eukprot:Skav225996  [mRNA]  locus=scaffold4003:250695:251947:+ [translate_table: standard]